MQKFFFPHPIFYRHFGLRGLIWAPASTPPDTQVTWSFKLWRSLFFDFSEGGSLNNDTHLDKSSPHHKDLGSHLLFRESASLGWVFDDHNSLSIMLDHISNAGLAKYNGGMETIGLRYGYHF